MACFTHFRPTRSTCDKICDGLVCQKVEIPPMPKLGGYKLLNILKFWAKELNRIACIGYLFRQICWWRWNSDSIFSFDFETLISTLLYLDFWRYVIMWKVGISPSFYRYLFINSLMRTKPSLFRGIFFACKHTTSFIS